MQILAGTQAGGYFGAALAAGDLDGDGFDDLVVGEPFRRNVAYSEGAVHVFLGNATRNILQQEPQSISGEMINGQFGTAVSFLGDLDVDGFGGKLFGFLLARKVVGLCLVV